MQGYWKLASKIITSTQMKAGLKSIWGSWLPVEECAFYAYIAWLGALLASHNEYKFKLNIGTWLIFIFRTKGWSCDIIERNCCCIDDL